MRYSRDRHPLRGLSRKLHLFLPGVIVLFLLSSCVDVESFLVFPGRESSLKEYDFSTTELATLEQSQWEYYQFVENGIPLNALQIQKNETGPLSGYNLTVLFYDNNNSSLYSSVSPGLYFRELGLDFFTIEYRGYGVSHNQYTTTEESLYADGAAAYFHLLDKLNEDSGRIVIAGFSLGTAVATETAYRFQEAGLMLFAPMLDADHVGSNVAGGYTLPAKWFINAELNNGEKIGSVRSPVCIFHGKNDELMPVEQSYLLFDRAEEPKRLYVHPTSSHSGIIDKEDWHGEFILNFIKDIVIP